MKLLLVSVVLLLLETPSRGQAPVCSQKVCPLYTQTASNTEFEERAYPATDWITTRVDGTGQMDLVAANDRLKAYCQKLKAAGHEMPDSWPVLITTTEKGDAVDVSLSWFVPPGVTADISDPSVTVEHKAAATVYVRTFGGTPSLGKGQKQAADLRDILVKAGKTFDPHTSIGAGYESYFSLIHHNEVWIYAA